MVNSPLIRPYFLGGVALGGGPLRFPWRCLFHRNLRETMMESTDQMVVSHSGFVLKWFQHDLKWHHIHLVFLRENHFEIGATTNDSIICLELTQNYGKSKKLKVEITETPIEIHKFRWSVGMVTPHKLYQLRWTLSFKNDPILSYTAPCREVWTKKSPRCNVLCSSSSCVHTYV